ncbi:hypothetical protein ACLEPN_44295, partial [Myxococcus sp. 1LA]
ARGQAEAFLRRTTLPGEDGPGGLGQLRRRLQVGRAARTLLLASSWCWADSRAMYARFFLGQTMESLPP